MAELRAADNPDCRPPQLGLQALSRWPPFSGSEFRLLSPLLSPHSAHDCVGVSAHNSSMSGHPSRLDVVLVAATMGWHLSPLTILPILLQRRLFGSGNSQVSRRARCHESSLMATPSWCRGCHTPTPLPLLPASGPLPDVCPFSLF